jgi:hypothetical protein
MSVLKISSAPIVQQLPEDLDGLSFSVVRRQPSAFELSTHPVRCGVDGVNTPRCVRGHQVHGDIDLVGCNPARKPLRPQDHSVGFGSIRA